MRLDVPFSIRSCRTEDLPRLEWEGRFAAHRSIFEDALAAQRRGGALLLVASRERVLLGQAFADLERTPGVAFLWAVRVRPALRGLGLGERLVRALEARVPAPTAEVTVDRDDSGALRFWRRLGYEDRGEVTERWSYTAPDGGVVQLAAERLVLRRELHARSRREMASRYPCSVPTSTYDDPA